MSNMKTVTVREAQHGLSALLERVRKGQELVITKRGRVVAKLVPAEARRGQLMWPDFEARMKRMFPKGSPSGKRLSEIVSEGRGAR
jgi:prevent-host-death family protein